MSRIRILLADDHPIVRRGLKTVLDMEDDIEIIGEAETGRQAIDLSCELKPDLVLLDLRLPEINGISACREIKATENGIQVLVLSTFRDIKDIKGAIEAGASGYLLKDIDPGDLINSIRLVAKGKTLFDHQIAEYVLGNGFGQKQSGEANNLSNRETEVLELMARGLKNKEIAETLRISQTTVKTHVSNILHKLNQSDRTKAVLTAIKLGVITVED